MGRREEIKVAESDSRLEGTVKDSGALVAYTILVAGGITIGTFGTILTIHEATSVELFQADDDGERLIVYLTVTCVGFLLASVALALLLRRGLRGAKVSVTSEKRP